MKKPQLGDWIEHNEPFFGRVNYGQVVQLLAAQFCYQPINSKYIRYCMFKEIWKPSTKKEAIEKSPESVESKAKSIKKRRPKAASAKTVTR